MTQKTKADAFFALHNTGDSFVIPNPWDIGSARIMAAKGFLALATTSAGVDHMNGKRSGTAGRDDILANAKMLAGATDLPLSIDLEDCYGADAAGIAETIGLAADTGAVGGSIEDVRYGGGGDIYPLDDAVARVRAAVEAAAALPFKFTLTARAENFLYGRPDLKDTIARLKAFADAGADVLYAPGIRTAEQVDDIVRAVGKPVNVLLGFGGTNLTMADMHQLGVARISLGSALHRASVTATLDAINEIQNSGTFEFTKELLPMDVVDGLME